MFKSFAGGTNDKWRAAGLRAPVHYLSANRHRGPILSMDDTGRSLLWLLPLLPYAAARWLNESHATFASPAWIAVRHILAAFAVSLALASGSLPGLSSSATIHQKFGLGISCLTALGLVLGTSGSQRVRHQWNYGLIWTAVRLLIPYMLLSSSAPRGERPQYLQRSGILAIVSLMLDTLQMVIMSWHPSTYPNVLATATFVTSVNVLAWANLAAVTPSVIPIVLLSWYTCTLALMHLTVLAIIVRGTAYKLGGTPAPVLAFPHDSRDDLSSMSFPGLVAYAAFHVSARLGPPNSPGEVEQIDPLEGLSTLVGLGPANQPAPQPSSGGPSRLHPSRLLPAPDLGVSIYAEVRPVSSSDASQAGGFGSEVRDLEVVPASQGDNEVGEFFSDWDGSAATLILLHRMYLAVCQQLGRLYLAIAWRMLERGRAPLDPFPVLQEPNADPTPEEMRLRCSLSMVSEEETWANLQSPPALAKVERGLRLFWRGRLGENAHRLRIAEMRQSLAAHKRRIIADIERLAHPSPAQPTDSGHPYISDRSTAPSLRSSSPLSFSDGKREGEASGYPACSVCFSSPRNIILWPCRCVNICEGCRIRMAVSAGSSPKPLCPTCRTPVRGFSRLYFP